MELEKLMNMFVIMDLKTYNRLSFDERIEIVVILTSYIEGNNNCEETHKNNMDYYLSGKVMPILYFANKSFYSFIRSSLNTIVIENDEIYLGELFLYLSAFLFEVNSI